MRAKPEDQEFPKLDLHVHTLYSKDGSMSPREAVKAARRAGLQGLAITDHNSVGALRHLPRCPDILVVPGIEVSSSDGHILGLDVTEEIPGKLSAEETMEKIRDAGGIGVVAHPYSLGKSSVRGGLIPLIRPDALEVVNSSSFPFFISTRLSRERARSLGLPVTGGSDAHLPNTVGLAYTVVYGNPESADDLIEAVREGRCEAYGRSRGLLYWVRKWTM
ncbi:MAG: CehA/McbA family metallohydrolase [Candidatus Bathyarchaeia archaeon]